jgi:enoyl-CoA hydratase
MAEFQNILYEKRGTIGYVTVNRPQALNALNQATIAELAVAFEQARDDETVVGIVLTGAGDKAFVAGADIGELAATNAVEAVAFTRHGQAVFSLIEDLGKPVIAAVNGFALGGGCELAMACTIRLGVAEAKFGQPETRLGVIPGFGGTQRLPRLVGKGRALQLILTAQTIDAAEAYRIGLLNEIVPRDRLMQRAAELVDQIAANAPIAIGFAIKAINAGLEGSLAEGLALEGALFAVCADTEDKQEGASAFLEKRQPKFAAR